MTGFYLLHVLVNDYILGWKWYDNVRDYGFICCTAEDFCNTLFPYTSDDPFKDNPILGLEKNYSNASFGEEKDYSNASFGEEKDYRKVLAETGTETRTGTDSRSRKEENEAPFPDIILIVNESFYDLAAQSNLQTDQDYLKDYYSIEGALYGFAECPNIGGRTNDSEYELLTGCSMDRLRASAPFNYLDLTQGPSLVRFLKKLGYETTAMHCGQPRIYSRDTGYRQLGFDHVILGQEHFPHHSWNGNREWLDEDNYKDLITCYERQGSGPRFFYLMTYQNHGSYDQNDSSQDTVHPIDRVKGTVLSDTPRDMSSKSVKGTVLGDTPTDMSPSTDQPTQQSTLLGPQTQEETAEYLSSIFLSARAIHRLTDYLAHRSRPVVVCMIGDHAPPLISQLPPRSSDREAGLREVPFMIWNNAGIDFSFRPSAQPSDQKALSTASIPFAYPADQAKAYRDRMGWKNQGLDMTEIMADLLWCVIGDGSL